MFSLIQHISRHLSGAAKVVLRVGMALVRGKPRVGVLVRPHVIGRDPVGVRANGRRRLILSGHWSVHRSDPCSGLLSIRLGNGVSATWCLRLTGRQVRRGRRVASAIARCLYLRVLSQSFVAFEGIALTTWGRVATEGASNFLKAADLIIPSH